MPCCGRPVFKTSPARWEPISMRASFGNSATPREPSIWPLMPTAMAAANRRRNRLSRRLRERGITARMVSLPEGHDPNSFFVKGGDARQFQSLSGGCSVMKFHVVHPPSPAMDTVPFALSSRPPAARSAGSIVSWTASTFAAWRTRRYAPTLTNLLHFVRWWESVHHTGDVVESALAESTLLDYLRFQSSRQPRPGGATINDRVALADRALRNEFPERPLSDRPGLSSDLFEAQADGNRTAVGGARAGCA